MSNCELDDHKLNQESDEKEEKYGPKRSELTAYPIAGREVQLLSRTAGGFHDPSSAASFGQ